MPLKDKHFLIRLEDMDRLRIRLLVIDGKIEDFVVQYETYIDQKWRDVVRYDASHGAAHRDLMDPRGETRKTWLENMTLQEAQIYAERDLRENWRQYRDQYLERYG